MAMFEEMLKTFKIRRGSSPKSKVVLPMGSALSQWSPADTLTLHAYLFMATTTSTALHILFPVVSSLQIF
jgi:hypothetical protein